jgi:hypothetical protein
MEPTCFESGVVSVPCTYRKSSKTQRAVVMVLVLASLCLSCSFTMKRKEGASDRQLSITEIYVRLSNKVSVPDDELCEEITNADQIRKIVACGKTPNRLSAG